MRTYSRSKSALTHFAMYMAHCYTSLNINCADPGVVDSDMITMHRWYDRIADHLFRPLISTPAQGAQALLTALNTTESGLLFHGAETKRLVSSLKDKDTFVNLLNNTLRIINREKK